MTIKGDRSSIVDKTSMIAILTKSLNIILNPVRSLRNRKIVMGTNRNQIHIKRIRYLIRAHLRKGLRIRVILMVIQMIRSITRRSIILSRIVSSLMSSHIIASQLINLLPIVISIRNSINRRIRHIINLSIVRIITMYRPITTSRPIIVRRPTITSRLITIGRLITTDQRTTIRQRTTRSIQHRHHTRLTHPQPRLQQRLEVIRVHLPELQLPLYHMRRLLCPISPRQRRQLRPISPRLRQHPVTQITIACLLWRERFQLCYPI